MHIEQWSAHSDCPTKSGGCQPAVDFQTPLQVPYAGFPRCELGESTEGLRPPLLCCRANVRRQKAIFAMHIRTFTRAAGVSPPWIFKPRCKCHTLDFRVANSVSPRGAYAPRSCIAVRMSVDKKAIFAMHIRTFTRAAGVSPPWVLRSRATMHIEQWSAHSDCRTKSGGCQPAVDLGSRTWTAVCRKSPASAFSKPRSAYADRSCCTTLRPTEK
jgi:hypothetical protein